MSALHQQSPRILLVRFGAMGDIIHSLPAAAALRREFPQARIDWLVETRWRDLLEPSLDGCLNQVFTLDTFELRRNLASADAWRKLRALIGQLRAIKFEIAVDLQGALKAAIACKLSGAPRIVGFAAPWLRESAARLFYNHSVSSSAAHIVEANLDLAASLNVPGHRPLEQGKAEFPIPTGDASLIPAEIPADNIAVLNPGAGWRSKQWPEGSFAVVCDRLLSEYGLIAVLNCGPNERGLAEAVQSACAKARPVIFTGHIPALIALLRRAQLMIGPDTGPLHLAAALGVPTVGIFGPTDPARNGPYGPRARSLRAPGARTCYQHQAPADGSMAAVSPAMVLAEVSRLLGRQPNS